jgi:hypothetical protein
MSLNIPLSYYISKIVYPHNLGSKKEKEKVKKDRSRFDFRTKMQARIQGKVQLKSPNWFLRIWTLHSI